MGRQGVKDDDLRTARGIVEACLASVTFWALVVLAWVLS